MTRKLFTILFLTFGLTFIYSSSGYSLLCEYIEPTALGRVNCAGGDMNGFCNTLQGESCVSNLFGDDICIPDDLGLPEETNKQCFDCGICQNGGGKHHPLEQHLGFRAARDINVVIDVQEWFSGLDEDKCRVVRAEISGEKDYFIPTGEDITDPLPLAKREEQWIEFKKSVGEDTFSRAGGISTCNPSLLDGICMGDCGFCGDGNCDDTEGEVCYTDIFNIDASLGECLECGECKIVCGDNRKEPSEDCDGTDLNNESCVNRGGTGGVLACHPAGGGPEGEPQCTFDTSGCFFCGDGTCQGGALGTEVCGIDNIDPACLKDCSELDPINGFGFSMTGRFSLGCCGDGVCNIAYGAEDSDNCKVDCGYCGDGEVGTREQCDGGAGGWSCRDLGNFKDGSLACHGPGHSQECMFDVSECLSDEIECVLNPGDAYSGYRSDACPFGSFSKILSGLYGSAVTSYCNPNPAWRIDPALGPEFDRTNLDPDRFRYNYGKKGLSFACLSPNDCQYDPIPESPPNTKGPGPVTYQSSASTQYDWIMYGCLPTSTTCDGSAYESGEECDGSHLNGQSCTSLGYDEGSLSCADDCLEFDISGCCSNVEQFRGTGCDACANNETFAVGKLTFCKYPDSWNNPMSRLKRFDNHSEGVNCSLTSNQDVLNNVDWVMWDNNQLDNGTILEASMLSASGFLLCQDDLGYSKLYVGDACTIDRQICIDRQGRSINGSGTVYYAQQCVPNDAPQCGAGKPIPDQPIITGFGCVDDPATPSLVEGCPFNHLWTESEIKSIPGLTTYPDDPPEEYRVYYGDGLLPICLSNPEWGVDHLRDVTRVSSPSFLYFGIFSLHTICADLELQAPVSWSMVDFGAIAAQGTQEPAAGPVYYGLGCDTDRPIGGGYGGGYWDDLSAPGNYCPFGKTEVPPVEDIYKVYACDSSSLTNPSIYVADYFPVVLAFDDEQLETGPRCLSTVVSNYIGEPHWPWMMWDADQALPGRFVQINTFHSSGCRDIWSGKTLCSDMYFGQDIKAGDPCTADQTDSCLLEIQDFSEDCGGCACSTGKEGTLFIQLMQCVPYVME